VKRRLPAVLFVHGRTNAASPKNLGQLVGWSQLVAASDLVGVSFSHRSAWTYNDTRAAVAYVRKNGARLGIDPSRIAVQTFAGGAPDGVADALAMPPGVVRCIVAYYGWLWGSLPAFSPIDFLKANPEGVPRMLIAKVTRDYGELNRSIDEFVAAALARDASVRLITYAKGEPNFDTIQHTARSRQIIRTTLAFLRETLFR
jgi:hypothetical protein